MKQLAAWWGGAWLLVAGSSALLGGCAHSSDWSAYGRTALGDRHSPLTQINRSNVSQLKVAWRFHTGETEPELHVDAPTSLEATPLVIDGTMYLSTPLGRVFALDPIHGTQRWVFDPKVDRKQWFGDYTNRGVSYWRDPQAAKGAPCSERIFVATIDDRLIALDAASGTPCVDFGDHGTVRLVEGLRNAPAYSEEYEQTSPPAIIDGLVVVGSAVADNGRIDAASGEVRAFDARTGARRWTWDPVPQDLKDPAYSSWGGPNGHRTGAANAWSVLAADPERHLVFAPTGSPSVDYFGGERLGDNRYANSIVALDSRTGRLVWHFQTVHHDLWDYDNASPPALVTVRRDGREVPAVLQATKTGQLFVLDRQTGSPLFPVEEHPVPGSDVPGEQAWPTQPRNTVLPSLSLERVTPEDAWGPTPEARAQCAEWIRSLRDEGPFTPPGLQGTLVLPSNVGGAHWGGVAFDPERQLAIVPTNRIAAVITLLPRDSEEARTHEGAKRGERIGLEYAQMRGTPYVLKRQLLITGAGPCTPPPFGELVAVDLKTGKLAWRTPLGTTAGLDKAGLKTPPSVRGTINLGGAITTAGGLVFIGATTDAKLHAYDVETGHELWNAELPATGKATPMTFMGADGKQYVVISAGGDGKVAPFGQSDEVIAFTLP